MHLRRRYWPSLFRGKRLWLLTCRLLNLRPSCFRGTSGDIGSARLRKCCCSCASSRLAPKRTSVYGLDRFRLWQVLVFLAGRDPHDLDGVADHVGGALLASGSTRHIKRPTVWRSLACTSRHWWACSSTPEETPHQSLSKGGLSSLSSGRTKCIPTARNSSCWLRPVLSGKHMGAEPSGREPCQAPRISK
jgi:hypothetical protein